MRKFNYTSEESLNAALRSFLPSGEDVALFEKNGWYTSPIILSDKIIDDAISGAEAFYQGERDYYLNTNDNIANSMAKEEVLKNNEFVCLQKKEIRNLAFHPLISGIAAKLSRTEEIRLFSDSLICKYPSNGMANGAIGWHSDKAYWPTCSSDKLITAWIPFQDCTIEMGTLVHLTGSNHWYNEPELISLLSFNDHKMNDFEEYLLTHKSEANKEPMLLKKGQVSFHSCKTIHGSYANKSNKKRMALAVHMQDKDNEYKRVFKEDGSLITIGYDTMCRKDKNDNPDYRDRQLFPIMWRENLR